MILSTLTRIRQVARNGDTNRAWQMYEQAGLAASQAPDVLALKGRLLKDRALRLEGADRVEMARQAVEAYRASAGSRRATYPLINAATIAYLCGDVAEARADAARILEIIASGDHEPETAYWLHATVAEAHLLLGDHDGARAALLAAVEAAPQAWEDRAATLRQLREILQVREDSVALLAGLSPPPSLHFGGIMDLAGHEDEVLLRLGEFLDEVRPGTVYGALAAGTDILFAELALERGAQLHVVLPGPLERFREKSVDAFGSRWGPRFEALLEMAHSYVEFPEQGDVTRTGIVQATQVAMGLAIRRARQLGNEAVAMHVGRVEEELAPVLASWKAQGLALHEIRRDWPPRGGTELLATGYGQAILACERTWGGEPQDAAEVAQTEDGIWLMRFADPVAAVRCACDALASQPDLQLGLDISVLEAEQPLVVSAERAICFARSAQRSEICGGWPHVCMMDLLEPGVRFEEAGEVVSPIGDLPVARYRPWPNTG